MSDYAQLWEKVGKAIGETLRDKVSHPDGGSEPAAEPTPAAPTPKPQPTTKQWKKSKNRPPKPKGFPPPAGYAGEYPGDFHGIPTLSYAPIADDLPDPGEVVWTWVPFEEDPTQGKDRPALIVGTDGEWLLGVMLTSQDHDLDKEQENSEGRYWVEIGRGDWDKQGRISEVRVDRLIRIHADHVRRIGGRLSERKFQLVADGIFAHLD